MDFVEEWINSYKELLKIKPERTKKPTWRDIKKRLESD